MEKIQIVWTNVYTGTIESYNQMIKDLGYKTDSVWINFCDENFNDCLEFTGYLKVYPEGIVLSPGDVYQYLQSKDMTKLTYNKRNGISNEYHDDLPKSTR